MTALGGTVIVLVVVFIGMFILARLMPPGDPNEPYDWWDEQS